MSNVLRFGFHPVQGSRARARRYEVASSYGTALYRGDACTLVTAGTIEKATEGGADLIAGVIKEFEYTSGGKRIRDHYLPATTVYSPTARGSVNASVVWVYDDPDMEFWVPIINPTAAASEATNWAGLGANMDIDDVDAGNTTMKRSGHALDGTFSTGAKRCTILELVRVPGRDLASNNFMARIRFAEHQLGIGSAGI